MKLAYGLQASTWHQAFRSENPKPVRDIEIRSWDVPKVAPKGPRSFDEAAAQDILRARRFPHYPNKPEN